MIDRKTIEQEIEAHLLQSRDWIPAADLAARWGVSERSLRDLDGRPGLCTPFAISRNKPGGYKHVSAATPAEWLEFKHSMRKHAIRELVRVRRLGVVRHQVVLPRRLPPTEADTGQCLFPSLCPA